jgi:hypothetical protein
MFFPPSIECTGRSVPLSVPRRFLEDFVHFARKMPLVALTRRMNLAEVVLARKALSPSPYWVLLFAKAFAIVARRRPELRQSYMTLPWSHLFECSESVASIAFERDYHGEPMVMFALVPSPEQKSIAELMRSLDEFRTQPVEEHIQLRRILKIQRLPKLLRRPLWHHALYHSGRIKAQNFGTFGISSVASVGATTVGMASLVTSTLSLGPFDSTGALDVRLDFDHRVYDGVPAAKAMAELERVLCDDIANELRQMAEGKK